MIYRKIKYLKKESKTTIQIIGKWRWENYKVKSNGNCFHKNIIPVLEIKNSVEGFYNWIIQPKVLSYWNGILSLKSLLEIIRK